MVWITAHFEIVLGTLLALGTTVLVLQQSRSPQSTAAWLLFIVAIP
jgi:cardiolipin synthase A/B